MGKKYNFVFEVEDEKEFLDHFDDCETVEEAMDCLKEDLNMEFAGVYGGIVITEVSEVKDDFAKYMNESEEEVER